MLGSVWHSWPVWVVLALAGCTDPQPRAINSTPLIASACLMFCQVELAVEAAEDNAGSGTIRGGDVSQAETMPQSSLE